MAEIVLVTGGARSGKSTFAEEYAKSISDKVLYIATSTPFDDEMKIRIRKHRERRPDKWQTVEAYRNLDSALDGKIKDRNVILLDCITVMISNLMMDCIKDWDNINEEDTVIAENTVSKELELLLESVSDFKGTLIIVTNEAGMGMVPVYASARLFRDMAGRANQKLARIADEVHLCVSGIPVRIK